MEYSDSQIIKMIIRWGVTPLVLLVLIFSSVGIVSAGEIGVKTRFGAIVSIKTPGLYVKLPYPVEKMNLMDVKTRTVDYDKNGKEGDQVDTSQLSGASKDLQDVSIGVVVNYHLDPHTVADIYTQYKSVDNYEYNAIEPIIREVVKSTSAQYTAEELVTKRADYSDKVNSLLADRLSEKHAILEKFSVTNFEFSQAFTESIEAKVTAVQNAEAAKNKLEQIKFEAQQTIETAKAQAQAISIQAQAINNQGGADYVQLQAIQKWNGQLPTQLVPGGAVPFINLKY